MEVGGPAWGRRVGAWWSLRSLPTQPLYDSTIWFYEHSLWNGEAGLLNPSAPLLFLLVVPIEAILLYPHLLYLSFHTKKNYTTSFCYFITAASLATSAPDGFHSCSLLWHSPLLSTHIFCSYLSSRVLDSVNLCLVWMALTNVISAGSPFTCRWFTSPRWSSVSYHTTTFYKIIFVEQICDFLRKRLKILSLFLGETFPFCNFPRTLKLIFTDHRMPLPE